MASISYKRCIVESTQDRFFKTHYNKEFPDEIGDRSQDSWIPRSLECPLSLERHTYTPPKDADRPHLLVISDASRKIQHSLMRIEKPS